MLERMRATEEDEEFERAFRSMVRDIYAVWTLHHRFISMKYIYVMP